MTELEGKRVVVGITGSIAAYKSAELVRLFEELLTVWTSLVCDPEYIGDIVV